MVSKTKVLNQEFSTAHAICPVSAKAAMTIQERDVILFFIGTPCLYPSQNAGKNNHHHLAKSIEDAGWSAFVTMLGYKGEWYGCRVEKISRWYPSSKTCSVCGAKMEAMPLNVRIWQCPMCGTVHDRDVNAAINILKQSTAGAVESNAWGQSVRPSADGYAGLTRKPTRFSGW